MTATFSPAPTAPAAPAPRRRRTGRAVGSALAAVTALAGLGSAVLYLTGQGTIDPASVRDEIVRITEDAVSVAPADVSCPAGIAFAAGSSFTCTGTVEGQEIRYWVHQDDGMGALTITHDRLIRFADLERAVADRLTGGGTVHCAPAGRTALVSVPGAPLACTAAPADDPASSVALTVTVDEDGTVAYRTAG
jgi:hypothetical protein